MSATVIEGNDAVTGHIISTTIGGKNGEPKQKFRHIMRELQGAIIVGSIFQCVLGLSGLMSLLLRVEGVTDLADNSAVSGLKTFVFFVLSGHEQVTLTLKPLVLTKSIHNSSPLLKIEFELM